MWAWTGLKCWTTSTIFFLVMTTSGMRGRGEGLSRWARPAEQIQEIDTANQLRQANQWYTSWQRKCLHLASEVNAFTGSLALLQDKTNLTKRTFIWTIHNDHNVTFRFFIEQNRCSVNVTLDKMTLISMPDVRLTATNGQTSKLARLLHYHSLKIAQKTVIKM